MSDEAIEQAVWDVVYLSACAVREEPASLARISEMDLDAVFEVSQRHLLTSACAIALEEAGVSDRRFIQARGKALRKVTVMDVERAALFERLDREAIWHMPLKGCVLQALYPRYGMRQMSDNDILFDSTRAEDVRNIMEGQGFSSEHFGAGAHDVYYKPPVCNFELHRMLFARSADNRLSEYYLSIEDLMLPDGSATYGRHLSDEDFYVYLVTHEYKHFSNGGTGLRSLLDTYVFLRAKGDGLDWEYVAGELEKLELVDYELQNRGLSLALFSGEKLATQDMTILKYMSHSGAYGTAANSVANQLQRYGRWGYFVRRLAPPLETMSMIYPMLGDIPVLLPTFWVWRLISAVVTKPAKVAYQFKAILS